MSDRPYHLFNSSPEYLYGRTRAIEEIRASIEKQTEMNLSLKAPSCYGKSILLKHIHEIYKNGYQDYLTSVYIDFQYETFKTANDVTRIIAGSISDNLPEGTGELAEFLDSDGDDLIDFLGIFFDELPAQEKRILLILDGLDYLLPKGGLSRELWQKLRAYGQKESVCYLAGSRENIFDLCRSETSEASNFYQIFYDPIVLGAFTLNDCDSLFMPITKLGVEVKDSAKKELINWSGGIPLLTISCLNRAFEQVTGKDTIDNNFINDVSTYVFEHSSQVVREIWEAFPEQNRHALVLLAKNGTLNDIKDSHKEELILLGLVEESRQHGVRSSCRIIDAYAKNMAPQVESLRKLFETEEDYQTSIPDAIELRWMQIREKTKDEDLAKHIDGAIRELHGNHKAALLYCRLIANRIFELIWAEEFDKDGLVPRKWATAYGEAGKQGDWTSTREKPQRPGSQLDLLRFVTGQKIGSKTQKNIAKKIRKPTILQLDQIFSVGNFILHLDDYAESEIYFGFSASLMLMIIELVDNLNQDFARQ